MKRYLEILPKDEQSADLLHELAKKILLENNIQFNEKEFEEENEDWFDILYEEVKKFAKEKGKISRASLQRNFKIGYIRSARLVDHLEEDGLIEKRDGVGPKKYIG